MDAVGIAALITAIMGALVTTVGAAIAVARWIKAQAKAELLREQSEATITAKNAEIQELEAENQRLWALLSEKSS